MPSEIVVPSSSLLPIEKFASAIVVWLYTKAGASRSTANHILHAIRCLLTLVFTVIASTLALHGITLKVPDLRIPYDIRTAYKRYFSGPKYTRVVCCPKCFERYPGAENLVPKQCIWKPSQRARRCGADLWKLRRTRKGIKEVPICRYTTQDFEPWTSFFVGRKVIDDALHATYLKLMAQAPPVGAEMNDVQDSPAFRNLFMDRPNPYNLIFAIYIDWFAMFKRKIAGE